MPKSLSVSLGIATLGAILFYFFPSDRTSSPSSGEFVAVALNWFNASAIVFLLLILAGMEKASAEDFGQVVRDNFSTIGVALFINLITTVHALLVTFEFL